MLVLKPFLGRPRTTLGCSPPLDAREPLTRGTPQSIIPEPRNSSVELSLQGWSGTPPFRDSSAQAFIDRGIARVRGFQASKGGENPRVVLGRADLLFPPLVNKVQNKGTQGVRARYDAELPPYISIVRCHSRPVI